MSDIKPVSQEHFAQVLQLIRQARSRALSTANRQLLELYWQVGQYLSHKAIEQGWGKGAVQGLADWLAVQESGLRGVSAQNLWRMKQFYELYQGDEILSALLRELSWTSNVLVMGRCKSREERTFYLNMAVKERWSSRELERQLDGCLFERVIASPVRASAALQALHPAAVEVFRDSYLLEFLSLPEVHSERDLQLGLIRHLKQFLLELGRDFCFVGQEFPVQVGQKDFAIDLLFFHRGLQALVAFELKIEEFRPAFLGQLDFYLEALDRDYRKPHEAPSIGVLLCRGGDADVVEYALSRSLSPTVIAEYKTRLPDKGLLQAKLEEFYLLVRRDVLGVGK